MAPTNRRRQPLPRVPAPALFLAAALTWVWGCPGEQPAPAPARAPAPTAPAAPAPPPSPVSAAAQQLGAPISAPDDVAAALKQADSLREWIAANPGHTDVAAAQLTASRLDVLAGAAALAGTGDAGGATQRLRDAVARLTPEATPGIDPAQAAGVREAALAILAVDPGVKDVKLNRPAALALAESATPEGQAVRAVWLRRAATSLQQLDALPPQLRVEGAVPVAGRLVCSRCSDVHHVTPDRVTPLLTSSRNTGGMICDQALAAGKAAKGPKQQLAALSLCEELWPRSTPSDPALLWGVNPVILGLIQTADRLSDLPVGDGPLKSPLQRAAEDVRELLSRPWALPAAFVAGAAADVVQPPASGAEPAAGAPAPRRPLAFIPELGSMGPAIAAGGLAHVIVGPDGVRAGLPPVVAIDGGRLTSLSTAAGLPAGGKLVMSLADLDAARPTADGGISAIASAAGDLRQAEARLGSAVASEPPVRTVTLVVDALARADHVVKTVDALRAAGVKAIHVARTASHGALLPLLMRTEPDALRPVLREVRPIGYEQPAIAVVAADRIDVWAPSRPEGGVQPAGDAKATPPEVAQPGFRGKELVRLRIAAGDAGLEASHVDLARQAVAYFVKRSGSAPLLHVVADGDARAQDVIRMARAFQEQDGKALPAPERIWPGTACGGPAWQRLGRKPGGCATGVSIAFSSTAAPSSRGVSSKPAGDRKVPAKAAPKPAEVEEPPPPPPSEDACDKKKIRVVMNRAKGQFRFCYQRELQLNPDIGGGRVALSFVIGPSGGVTSARVTKNSFKSQAISSCIVKNAKRLTFPKPKEGSCPVRWPFTFNPR